MITGIAMTGSKALGRSRSALGILALALALTATAPSARAQIGIGGGSQDTIIDAMEERDFDAFKLALVNETRPTLRDSAGVPAIILAVETREEFFVEELLKAGARPDDRPRRKKDDRTALTQAAAFGETAMVKALLAAGADPELPGERNEPALIKAAHLGHLDVARLLVEGGADLQNTDMTGRTALEVAERSNQVAVAQYLREADAQ